MGVSTLRPRPLTKILLGNEITSFPQSLEWPRGTQVAGRGTACPLAVHWVAVPLLRLGCRPRPFCATPVLTLQAQVRQWHPLLTGSLKPPVPETDGHVSIPSGHPADGCLPPHE